MKMSATLIPIRKLSYLHQQASLAVCSDYNELTADFVMKSAYNDRPQLDN